MTEESSTTNSCIETNRLMYVMYSVYNLGLHAMYDAV